MSVALQVLRERVALRDFVAQLEVAHGLTDKIPAEEAISLFRDVHGRLHYLTAWLADRSADAASFRVWVEMSPKAWGNDILVKASGLHSQVEAVHTTMLLLTTSLDPGVFEAVAAKFVPVAPLVSHLRAAEVAIDRVLGLLDGIDKAFGEAMSAAEEAAIVTSAMHLSQPSLSQIWDNDEDAKYDALV